MAALARRFSSILLTAVMVMGVVAPGASAASHESDAFALLNAERAANGLSPVAMHSDLTDDALVWSQHMLAQGALSHNPSLSTVTTGWDKLGENVGVGVTIESLHAAFMASAGHRGNILGDYDYVGIAVVEETASKLWITVVFMKAIGSTPVADAPDDPEPYANPEPAPASAQPIAGTVRTTSAAAGAAHTPTPIVFVRSGATPTAD